MSTRELRSFGLGLALALFFGIIAGCGGTEPPEPIAGSDMAGAAPSAGGDMAGPSSSGDGGLLPLFAACTDNSQCQSMLCTMQSYDRSATPICTYACDPTTDTNPLCPMGCNPKFFCKKPNN